MSSDSSLKAEKGNLFPIILIRPSGPMAAARRKLWLHAWIPKSGRDWFINLHLDQGFSMMIV